MKDIVPEDGINALKTGIQDMILTISGEILGNTWAEIEYRLDTLWTTNGTQVEVY